MGTLDECQFSIGRYGIMDTIKALLTYLLLVPTLACAHGGYHCHNSGASLHSQNTRASHNSVSTHSVKPQSLSAQAASTTTASANDDVERNLILKIQYALNQLGYAVGKPDGILGKKTINGIQHFQVDNEMTVDGRPSALLLEALLRKVRE